jgi:hypothetical protein
MNLPKPEGEIGFTEDGLEEELDDMAGLLGEINPDLPTPDGEIGFTEEGLEKVCEDGLGDMVGLLGENPDDDARSFILVTIDFWESEWNLTSSSTTMANSTLLLELTGPGEDADFCPTGWTGIGDLVQTYIGPTSRCINHAGFDRLANSVSKAVSD